MDEGGGAVGSQAGLIWVGSPGGFWFPETCAVGQTIINLHAYAMPDTYLFCYGDLQR